MKKIPDLIYIAGVRDEKTAVKEAAVKNVKTIGIVDTNANPNDVTYLIAANDDAIKSLDLITSLVAEAVKDGRQEYEKRQLEEKNKEDKVKKI